MKKCLKILLILFLFLSCYFIYKFTDRKKINYLAIGNDSSFNEYVINSLNTNIQYNDLYTDNDYRIVDLVNIIKYNEEKDVSIHYLLKKSDILTIFIGMNELYSNLNNDTKSIYNYLNDMVNDMNDLLMKISEYDYDNVYVLGYYCIDKNKNDIFTYINYKIKVLTHKYGYNYVDLNGVIDINDLIENNNYKLNEKGKDKISKIILAYLKNY